MTQASRIILALTVLFLVINTNCIAQPFINKVYKHQIKTVQCHKEDWPLTYPIIRLNSDEKLAFSFDDIYDESRDFYYSIIHCDENWETSQLLESEYMNGINGTPLLDYHFSYNANINYVHYKLTIPNDDIELTVSGNYIIKIYEDGDSDDVVLTQRFMINEQRISILPEVKYTMNQEIRKAKQEIDLIIKHPDFDILNPIEEVKVSIIQNGRIDNAITKLKPLFIKHKELDYNYNREVMFEGSNEFRWLDTRSLRFQSSTIHDITFHDPYSHVQLKADPIMMGKSYYFNNDFNGRYIIDVQERDEPELTADYAFVHFFLPRAEPLINGDVYIIGALTDWQMNNDSKMTYNFNLKAYEKTLLLKQGFYNYQYAFKENDSQVANVGIFEGSHSETENDYLILVYYRGVGDYYDRLIGVSQVNSIAR